MQTADEIHAQRLTSDSKPAQPAVPLKKPSLLRRFGAAMRDQSRFSLLTMLEWLAAYTLVFTAAWFRADNRLLAGIFLGIVLSGLMARVFLRSEGRRVAHYLVFSLAIALGGFSGAVALREQRARAAEPLIEQDRVRLEAIAQELLDDAKELTVDLSTEPRKDAIRIPRPLAKPGTTDLEIQDWVNAEWISSPPRIQPFEKEKFDCALAVVTAQKTWVYNQDRERRDRLDERDRERKPRMFMLRTRECQIRDEAKSLDFLVAPIPSAPEGWSPQLVPVYRRSQLHVTCDLIDCDAERLKRTVMELSGLQVEYAPTLNMSAVPNINLRVTDMSTDLWLLWNCKLMDLKFHYEQDKVIIEHE